MTAVLSNPAWMLTEVTISLKRNRSTSRPLFDVTKILLLFDQNVNHTEMDMDIIPSLIYFYSEMFRKLLNKNEEVVCQRLCRLSFSIECFVVPKIAPLSIWFSYLKLSNLRTLAISIWLEWWIDTNRTQMSDWNGKRQQW